MRSPFSSLSVFGDDIFCQWIGLLKAIDRYKNKSFGCGKRKKSRGDFSPLPLFRLVTSPRYFAKPDLLQRGFGYSASPQRRAAVTNNRMQDRGEGTYASGVRRDRNANGLIARSRGAAHAGHLERVAALGTGS